MNIHSTDSTPPPFAIDAITKSIIQDTARVFKFPFSERRALLVTMDAIIICLAVFGAFLLWQRTAGIAFSQTHIIDRWYWFPIMLGGWNVLSWFNDLYDIPTSYRRTLTAVRVAIVGGLGFGLYLIVFFTIPESLPRLFVIYFLILAMPAVTLWRWTYSIVFCAPPFRHRVLIIGVNERGKTIAKALKKESITNYRVVGFLDSSQSQDRENTDSLPIVGLENDLLRLVKQLRIQEIVVALEQNLEPDLFLCLIRCQTQGVEVSWMPDLYEKLCRSVPIQHVDPAWALYAMQGKQLHNRLQIIAKRLLDLTIILFAFPVFLLIIPGIALAIRLDSPGPVFYRQTRCGRAGKPFKILKFRTMVTNAEKDGKARWARKNDPRITRMGQFLRKSRLDELPQLINVLRGEMSIVGPRPERPEFVKDLEKQIPLYPTRLTVKPGITGWAQIHYDYGNSVEDALVKLQYDFYYVRYLSLVLDVYILFRTVGVLVKMKGM